MEGGGEATCGCLRHLGVASLLLDVVLQVACQNLLHVTRAHGGLVWLAAIGKELDGCLARMSHLIREVVAEDDGEVGIVLQEHLLDFFLAVNVCHDGEIAVVADVLLYASGHLVLAVVEDDDTGIFHLRGDGEAEEDDHDDRHDQQNQHRTLVAEDVAEFLSYEYDKLFHCVMGI